MERHLNLVQSDFEELEKKIFPRFPFCFLTFKTNQEDCDLTYEVKDISHTGMQVALRMGTHQLQKEQRVQGKLHWSGLELEIAGEVRWSTQMRAGIEFNNSPVLRERVSQVLDLALYADRLKPIHLMDYGVEIPARLKAWLRADGPVEIFVWQHGDGELAGFQILMMENFVEWEDGVGLKTARVISKRDIDTPLLTEDEFVFQVDQTIDDEKIAKASRLVNNIASEKLESSLINFISLKLRS